MDDSELLSLSPTEFISNKLMEKTDEISTLFKRHFGLADLSEFGCAYYLDPYKNVQIGGTFHNDLHSEIGEILNKNEKEIKQFGLKENIIDYIGDLIRTTSE